MASIVERTFDATKGIVRTLFRGKPNLFTTSDLNRQVEALKYQMDLLDKKVGVLSDVSFDGSSYDSVNNMVNIMATFSYLEALGVDFTPFLTSPASASMGDVTKGSVFYIIVGITYKVVTYDDDFSHEIAGASFVDGTSKKAADQKVIDVCSFALVEDLETTSYEDFIVLGEAYVSFSDSVVTTPRATMKGADVLRKLVETFRLPCDFSPISYAQSIPVATDPAIVAIGKLSHLLSKPQDLLYKFHNGEYVTLTADNDFYPTSPASNISVQCYNGILSVVLQKFTIKSEDMNCIQAYACNCALLAVLPEELGQRLSEKASVFNRTYSNQQQGTAKKYYTLLWEIGNEVVHFSDSLSDEICTIAIFKEYVESSENNNNTIMSTGRVLIGAVLNVDNAEGIYQGVWDKYTHKQVYVKGRCINIPVNLD